jgi:predicted DCC family thiol-disulfide oxidoreductase YuxK
MRTLTVLYDAECKLCQASCRWLARQRKLVPMGFVAAGSIEARRRFPGIDPASTFREVTVVADSGEVYRGAKAWVMCLWALEEYRRFALSLGTPDRLRLARQVVAWVSRHRKIFGTVPAPAGAPPAGR